MIVWDREDYIKEAENQLGDTNIYEEVPNDAQPLVNIILNTLENICERGDHCTDTLNYFLFKDAKFARFSLLLKIHKRLCNVQGRPVISNCGYYTENNDFMKKLCSLTNLPGNSLLCTIDVVGLYPNIPHDEGLSALRKRLNERDKKDVSTDTLVELAELVLKNNIFNFNERTLKQKRGTAIGTVCSAQ